VEEKTDIELVEMAQEGDKEAFGCLVQRYQMIVQRFARRLVSNTDLAQELTQEALLQAYLSLSHLQDPGSFRSWLCGIVLNVCRSYMRDQKSAFFSLEALAGGLSFDALPVSVSEINPNEIAEERELHQNILKAVNTLPQGDRDITMLFYYNELSLREIATLWGISLGAVKVRLHRARQRLKIRLLSDYPEIVPDSHQLSVISSQSHPPSSKLTTENCKLNTHERREIMVKVTIADVIKKEIREEQGHSYIDYVVVLHDEAGKRVLPIWVGPFEGQSIVTGLSEFATPRPLTFEFIANLLKAIDARIEEVRVETLKGSTFYAVVKISCGKTTREIDARPSDAMALALRTGSPIVASEEVLERLGIIIPEGARPGRHGMEKILKEISEEQKIRLEQLMTLPKEPTTKAKEEFIAEVFKK
jgi:RNA polymerase sigma factor (sigma-70 family)